MNESQDTQKKPYEQFRYFGMALDPIHIGTGGYRLGRVDNTIARDPATNLPILFGSSIEGTMRTYSAYALIEDDNSIKNKQGKAREYLDCAGKSVEDVEEEKKKRRQCGECEVCVTYGFSNKARSLHGMAQFSDAKLLFFPVHTMLGPVWVTCSEILKDNQISITDLEDRIMTKMVKKGEKLNLGWIYLENQGNPPLMDGKFQNANIPDEVLQRSVITSDSLFPQIVNSNLEVRTSVSIDPRTGAAEEGALFTYEAIPRGTVMYFTVTILDPSNFEVPEALKDREIVKSTVKKGLILSEYLGLGGMGTRGFGRFKILNLESDEDGK